MTEEIKIVETFVSNSSYNFPKRVYWLNKAIRIAAQVHEEDYAMGSFKANQYGLVPFIYHPLRVSEKARRFNVSIEETEIVAILHDSIEHNPDYFLTNLEREFKDHPNKDGILKSIQLLTKNETKETDYYQSYIDKIVESNDFDALVVKCADLEDNMENYGIPYRDKQTNLSLSSHKYGIAYQKIMSKMLELNIKESNKITEYYLDNYKNNITERF